MSKSRIMMCKCSGTIEVDQEVIDFLELDERANNLYPWDHVEAQIFYYRKAGLFESHLRFWEGERREESEKNFCLKNSISGKG